MLFAAGSQAPILCYAVFRVGRGEGQGNVGFSVVVLLRFNLELRFRVEVFLSLWKDCGNLEVLVCRQQ